MIFPLVATLLAPALWGAAHAGPSCLLRLAAGTRFLTGPSWDGSNLRHLLLFVATGLIVLTQFLPRHCHAMLDLGHSASCPQGNLSVSSCPLPYPWSPLPPPHLLLLLLFPPTADSEPPHKPSRAGDRVQI